jgi:hypothetical protein
MSKRLFCSPIDVRLGSMGYELRGWSRLELDWIDDIDLIFDDGSCWEDGFDEVPILVAEDGFENGLVDVWLNVCCKLY